MLRVLSSEEICLVAGGLTDQDPTDNGGDPFGADGQSGWGYDPGVMGGEGWSPTYVDPATGDIVVTAPGGNIDTGVTWSDVGDALQNVSDAFGTWEEVGVVVTGAAGAGAAAQLGLDVPNDVAVAAAAGATGGMAAGKLITGWMARQIKAMS